MPKNNSTSPPSLDTSAPDNEAEALREVVDPMDGGTLSTGARSLLSVAALIRVELASTPVSPTISLRALVVELRQDLLAARRGGKSWKAIAESFRVGGLDPEPDTIRLYVSKAMPTKAARAAKRATPVPATAKVPAIPPTDVVRTPTKSPDVSSTTRSDGARIAPRVK